MNFHNKIILIFVCTTASYSASAQANYEDSIREFQKNYVDGHEVVKAGDKNYMSFYKPDIACRVVASFKKIEDKKGFEMYTSEGKPAKYFVFGVLTFVVHDTAQKLYVYQSESLMKTEEYKDYLYVPFGDASSGFESYGGGRYLDFRMNDIKGKTLTIDFNKAYNPYCAYATGYNCPLPPKENILVVEIKAGEKNYGKGMH